jgi:anti-anti-sigma regulatory factor
MIEDNTSALKAVGITELVRGNERRLLDELTPVVRREDVALDFGRVEKIDAAGIAALIALYRAALESGRSFQVTNAAPRVREMLAMVGLEGILLSQSKGLGSNPARGLTKSAA